MNVKSSAQVEQKVLQLLKEGLSGRQVALAVGVDESTVRAIKKRNQQGAPATTPNRASGLVKFYDKKTSTFNWRNALDAVAAVQKMHRDGSRSQNRAKVRVGDGKSPIGILCWGDQHIGARGTDYQTFLELTNILIETPNLFAVLTGDVAEWAVKLRGVAEVCAQALDPALQLQFVEQWFDEIKHKVVCATWGNHTDDRSEAAIGACPVKEIIARHVPYFSGIGHLDLEVGSQSYAGAISHKFQGVTQLDSTAGCKKYLRMEYPTGDFAIQGDCHRAGVSIYNEGPSHRVAISNGTHNVHSSFAQRYFSIVTSQAMPVLTFWPDKKRMVPFFNIDQFLAIFGAKQKHNL